MRNIIFNWAIFLLLMLTFSCKDDLEESKLEIDFTADTQEILAGDTVNFKDLSVGNPSKWNWTFEGADPSSSVLHSPSVIYPSPGTYTVKLVVSRGSDSTSLIREGFVTVGYPEVTAGFTASATSVIQGESITFTDQSKGIPTAWVWEFIPSGGGETLTSSEQNPTVTFGEPGVYSVKLTVTNPNGSDELIKTDEITIIDASSVEAGFSANLLSTYAGGTINFTDASIGTANAWAWTFEGGTPATSTEQNPSVTYASPGRYKVTLVASNDFKSSEKSVDDFVLVIPSEGLVAFYPFDGSEKDTGPNGFDPVQLGEVVFTGTDRLTGTNKTAVFDGSSALIVPDNDAFNFGTADFSVSCWVKTGLTNKMFIWMESGKGGSKDNQAWHRMGNNTSTQLLQLATEDQDGGSFVSVGENGRVSDDVWHHTVCVREGLVTRVYVDGVKVGEATAKAVKNVSNEADFKIGVQEGTGGFNNYFNGQMDDMIIYGKALTDEEVAELFGL